MSESKPATTHKAVWVDRQRMPGELMQHIFSILCGSNGDAVDCWIISRFARESDDKTIFEFPVYRIAYRNGSVFTVGYTSPGWLVSASLSMPVDLTKVVASGTERLDDTAGFPNDVLFGSYADNPIRFTVRFMTTYDVRDFFRCIARAFPT